MGLSVGKVGRRDGMVGWDGGREGGMELVGEWGGAGVGRVIVEHDGGR